MRNRLYDHPAFDRKGVLVLGKSIDSTPFTERNLAVIEIGTDIEKANQYISNCRAIIIFDNQSEYKLIRKAFESLFPDASNLSILQIVLYHTEEDHVRIEKIQEENGKSNLSQIYRHDELSQLAEKIARHKCGSKPMGVIIEPKSIEQGLNQEVKLLLQRSFFDCERIYLESIIGGRDSSYLFKVYARIKDSQVGCPLPLPFFAKVASPHKKIEDELKNYAEYTDMYIPFQYRPNYRPERCISTKDYSILVGNFVDSAISLRTSLEETHNSGIIFSLFEKSLHGLRLQPFVQKKARSKGELLKFIKEIVGIDRLLKNEDIINEACKLGLNTDLNDMYELLLVNCPDQCLIGTIHGDLHSGNIMVRGNDAILIDFSAMRDGPLTADPITLEVSLSFNLGERKPPEFANWKEFIDYAYSPDFVIKALTYTEEVPNEFFWLRRSIREIRHILLGCECSQDEIKVIMASYLMRIARLSPSVRNGVKEEFEFKCHAYALIIAKRIIDSLPKKLNK